MKLVYAIPQDRLAKASKQFTNARPVLRTVQFHGIPVSIEIEAGQSKSGIDEAGNKWSHLYKVPYGEIPSTKALSDGDAVDVYLGPNAGASMVYVVHQLRRDGKFDEDKCMLGFPSAGEAVAAYKSHGPSWGFGSMDTMTADQFIHGYLASNRSI